MHALHILASQNSVSSVGNKIQFLKNSKSTPLLKCNKIEILVEEMKQEGAKGT